MKVSSGSSSRLFLGGVLLVGCVKLSTQTSSPMGGGGGGYGGNSYYSPQNQQREHQYQAAQQQVYSPYQQEYEPQQQQPQEETASTTEQKEEEEEEPPLPPGWTKYTDPESGRAYYFNETDGTTTWERPVPSVDETATISSNDSIPKEDSPLEELVPIQDVATTKEVGNDSEDPSEQCSGKDEDSWTPNNSNNEKPNPEQQWNKESWDTKRTATTEITDKSTIEEPAAVNYAGYETKTDATPIGRRPEEVVGQSSPTGYGAPREDIMTSTGQRLPEEKDPRQGIWGRPPQQDERQQQVPPGEQQRQFQPAPFGVTKPYGQETQQKGFGQEQQ